MMKYGDPKFKNWMISCLRRLTFKWMPKNEAKKLAKVEVGKFSTGRIKYGYRCNMCNEVFKSKDVQVDHIKPIIDPVVGFESFDKLIENMFCQIDNLQVLCKLCHDKKTKEEKQLKKTRSKS